MAFVTIHHCFREPVVIRGLGGISDLKAKPRRQESA
jgi:hypothetical protein